MITQLSDSLIPQSLSGPVLLDRQGLPRYWLRSGQQPQLAKATLDKEHGLIGVYLPTAARNSEGQIIVPGRLLDNIKSGFALWLSWQQLTADTAQLDRFVADAKSRSSELIVNTRERRLRNV